MEKVINKEQTCGIEFRLRRLGSNAHELCLVQQCPEERGRGAQGAGQLLRGAPGRGAGALELFVFLPVPNKPP